MGPEDTEYEGGAFTATLTFPQEYPMLPPKMKFTCPMWHPNSKKKKKHITQHNTTSVIYLYNFIFLVYPSGEVCISILHAPGEDPNHYEQATERWSPVQSIEKILLSVISMLAEPNDESPANLDAAKMWRTDREEYKRRVRKTVEQSLASVDLQSP